MKIPCLSARARFKQPFDEMQGEMFCRVLFIKVRSSKESYSTYGLGCMWWLDVNATNLFLLSYKENFFTNLAEFRCIFVKSVTAFVISGPRSGSTI